MSAILRSPAARIWALDGALVAAAAALCAVLAGWPASTRGPHVPFLLLVGLFALAELSVVHLHFRRSAHSFTLAEVPLVVGLLFMPPLQVVLAWAVGAGVVMAVAVRMPPPRLLFNIALFAITGAIAALVVHASGPHPWVGAVLGVLAGSAASAALIALAMSSTGERLEARRLATMLVSASAASGINASLGLGVAALLDVDPWKALTLVPVAAALFLAYRASASERAKHRSLEFIYAAGRALSRSADPLRGLAGVLALALDALRAEVAEAFLLDGAGSRIAIVADQSVQTDSALAPPLAAALRELDGRARIVTPEQVPGPLAEHLRRRGVERAMLAPLPGDERPLGFLLIANRLGLGAFGGPDLRLFETLAQHVGSSLGQDRLGRRLRELHALRDELEHRAFHDPLTGLANRLLFEDRVRHALTRRNGTVAVIYIDLDDFKPVNDSYGHDAGDELLRTVAARLDDSLRAEDTPARLGGDEFAVVLLDVTEAQARIVTDRLLAAFRRPVRIAGRELSIRASLGIAISASDGLGADELIRRADTAMYVSKHAGKCGYRVYEQSMELR